MAIHLSSNGFCKHEAKYLARELHIARLYPLFTGKDCLPEDKQYWFLSSLQERTETSEVYQVTKQRDFGQFVTFDRCYGVDRDKEIIKKNKKFWPEVKNWIGSEWSKAIISAAGRKIFNPALVYLDTTSFEDKETSVDLLRDTLSLCKKDTLVICNVMMNNPRAGLGDRLFDPNLIIDNLEKSDNEDFLKDWNVCEYDKDLKIWHSYEYQTSCTVMRSYIFFRGVLPKESDLFNEFEKYKDWCIYQSSSNLTV